QRARAWIAPLSRQKKPVYQRVFRGLQDTPSPTPIPRLMIPPTATNSSEERIGIPRKRFRIHAIANSSIATTAPATTSACLTLEMRKGSVWKMLPSTVIPPVIDPRTTADPRPVSSPVSDPASDHPLL